MALRAGSVGPGQEAGLEPQRGWASLPAWVSARAGRASPDWRGVRPVDRPGCAVEQSAASADAQQLTQNWHGPGESDCLIKTEHCDVRNRGIDAM